MGTPVLLKATVEQYPELFLSHQAIAYQLLALAKLNWRTSEFGLREPITLDYAKRLAYLTALMEAQEWQNLTASETLRGRPWFI